MTDRIIRPAESSAMIGVSEMQERRLEEAGLLPRRFKTNPNGGKNGAVGKLESWVNTYIALVSSGASADEVRDWAATINEGREKRLTVGA